MPLRARTPVFRPFEFGVAHILVVEDNPVVRMLAENHLESGGHTVMTAVDGIEALQRVSVVRPDLVLSDIDMPRLDGLGRLKALRADPALAAIPDIFLPMYDDMETFRVTRELGALLNFPNPLTRKATYTPIPGYININFILETIIRENKNVNYYH